MPVEPRRPFAGRNTIASSSARPATPTEVSQRRCPLHLIPSQRDAQDARVRWVVRTSAGEAVSERASAAIEASEARLRAQVGVDRYEAMKDMMRELGAGFV